MLHRTLKGIALPAAVLLCGTAAAQTTAARSKAVKALPDAPPVVLLAQNAGGVAGAGAGQQPTGSTGSGAQIQTPTVPPAPAGTAAPEQNGGTLTRAQAEQMALKNNPRISVSKLLALAQGQVVRETRAAELPQLNGAATAMYAENATRISAGSLTASRLFSHAGAGANFQQLLTDFGRTRNLVASSKLQLKSQNANAMATTQDILLATDQAFYNALQAQAMLRVAQQTVQTRGTTETQVNKMTQNKLKSTLDLSFADVDLSQAQLLQLDAENNVYATMADLDAVLGLDRSVHYDLLDDQGELPPPPADAEGLIQLALKQRPDLQSLNYNEQASKHFARAQFDQILPNISALGTIGTVPINNDRYYTANWWGGVGVNMNVPIFDGFLYVSQAKEANLRARAAAEQSRDLRDNIVRDVQTTWLQTRTAFQRVGVTAQLLKEANMALGLAQTRYQLGLSNIVELSQAQLQQTDAQISNTNAQYQYRLSLATLNYEIGEIP